ncbi:nuclease-related domain-containing protein [Jeotgalibaca sp. A127]|uniref:nuclease-related domain-containing protein n=1 Tax=Jeotgalibaca sp. A127 TaxID=3457324 RepID=UPI003FD1EF96
MLMKKREMAVELRVLRALQGRMVFSPRLERQLRNSESGQVGECSFDELGARIDDCAVRLNDLVLVVGGKLCQIDALYICDGVVYLFEVKNWMGAFDLMDGDFVGLSACPLAQLKRSRMLLEELLRSMRVSVRVESRLVFVGTGVSLYGLRRDDPVLLPHQVQGYLNELRIRSGGFLRDSDVRLGQRLANHHVVNNPYQQLAKYCVEDVAGGVLCGECRVRMVEYSFLRLTCPRCNIFEHKRNSLERTILELDTLFPPEKQRVHQIYLWCDKIFSKRMIHDYLKQ